MNRLILANLTEKNLIQFFGEDNGVNIRPDCFIMIHESKTLNYCSTIYLEEINNWIRGGYDIFYKREVITEKFTKV